MSLPPKRDPFEGLTLDDDFVRAASKREPSASDRAARAAELRARLDAAAAAEFEAKRIQRRAERSLRRRMPARNTAVMVVVLSVLAGYMWWERSRSDAMAWAGGAPVTGWEAPGARPTPVPADSDEPLGEAMATPSGGGAHSFIATQPNSSAPVTYDPCRPIPIVVNERTMPSAAQGLVAEALDEVSTITGLQFQIEGRTDEPPTDLRRPFQPDRYGDRWAPVLIAWSDPEEHPALHDEVAGLGGSQPISVSPEEMVYVTGIVYLDGGDFEKMLSYDDGWAMTKSVVTHELGHLLGLGHVDDPGQLMYPSGGKVHSFANGDLTGLALLSRGACFSEL